jgi:hypothetical protein
VDTQTNSTRTPSATDRVLIGMRRVYALRQELAKAARELEAAVADVQREQAA